MATVKCPLGKRGYPTHEWNDGKKDHIYCYGWIDLSVEEWKAEAERRFGPDMLKWKFRCPMCGHIASVQDFKDAGAKSPSCAYQECLGRYTGKGSPKKGDSSGCNWAAYGLLGIPAEHDTVVVGPDEVVDVYPYA